MEEIWVGEMFGRSSGNIVDGWYKKGEKVHCEEEHEDAARGNGVFLRSVHEVGVGSCKREELDV